MTILLICKGIRFLLYTLQDGSLKRTDHYKAGFLITPIIVMAGYLKKMFFECIQNI